MAGEGSRTVVVVLDGDVEIGRATLDGVRQDLVLVDVLARLQLAARRLGCSVVVRHPSPELREVLDLVGLAGVIELAGSALEADGQAEDREELGVEEVLPGGDPPG